MPTPHTANESVSRSERERYFETRANARPVDKTASIEAIIGKNMTQKKSRNKMSQPFSSSTTPPQTTAQLQGNGTFVSASTASRSKASASSAEVLMPIKDITALYEKFKTKTYIKGWLYKKVLITNNQ